jgi:multiple sugar transport system ATP-binding protein
MNFATGEDATKRGAHTIGIRPEHIDVTSEGGAWNGTVGVAEHLGSDTFLHVHDTGLAETITVRAPGDLTLRYGDKVNLSPREDLIHRFDAEGLRIA